MELFAYLHGIYPRSEALVRATRDHDRGRIPDSELHERYEQDYAQLVGLQRDAGLRPLSDGLLNWQDLFRPLSEIVRGWEPGSLVRYFDTNAFYRRPRITQALRPDEDKLDGWLTRYVRTDLAEGEPWVATLPSPLFFAYASWDEHKRYGSRRALARAYVEDVLGPLLAALTERGVRWVQLQEPWLVVHRPEEGLDVLRDALSKLARYKPQGLALALHTYFGDAAPVFPGLLELDVDAVGADFVATDLEALPPLKGKTLLLGCLDARESWVETPDQIVEFAHRALEELQPDGLALVPNADLEFVPEAIARRKVGALGAAQRRLREAI